MFSYLRPHHKRTPSIPSSPAEQQPHSLDAPSHSVDNANGHLQGWQGPSSTEWADSSISRLTLGGADNSLSADSLSHPRGYERGSRAQGGDASKGTEKSRDTFSYGNHQRIGAGLSQRQDPAGSETLPKYTHPQHTHPQHSMIQAGLAPDIVSGQRPLEGRHAFPAATETQSNTMPTGRRAAGGRLPAPAAPVHTVSTFEPIQPKSAKGRLNLLNPISLLSRRRTSQAVPHLAPETLATNRTSGHVPENLDFRIRGTVVHDFSAPRPRNNPSYNDTRAAETANSSSTPYQRGPTLQGEPNATDDGASGPWCGGRHTPVFTENFEEEQYPAAGPHVRKANDLTDFALPNPPYAKGAQRPSDLTLSGSNNNEPPQKSIPTPENTRPQDPLSDVGPPVPPKAPRSIPSQGKRISIDSNTKPSKLNLSSRKYGPHNVPDVLVKDAAIPKHMKSTSSRFSFDMIGAAEQERLLEDRHRQRALEKRPEVSNGDDHDDFVEDDYDYENMDDDDGLEERIPGVNADFDEEDDEDIPAPSEDNLTNFTFQQSWLDTSLSPSSPGMAQTPRDANGDVIGFAVTKNSPLLPEGLLQSTTLSPVSPSPHVAFSASSFLPGLGLQDIGSSEGVATPNAHVDAPRPPQQSGIDDDDLYFDDGIIGGLGHDNEVAEFDESIFDKIDTDKYGRPLKPLSSIPTLYSPPTLTSDPSPTLDNKPKDSPDDSKGATDSVSFDGLSFRGSLAPKASMTKDISTQATAYAPPTLDLTQDSLAAYQSALAAAAFTAAANGKFRRGSSPPIPALSEGADAQPGLMSDSSHNSHYESFSPSYDVEDDFDYDDTLEDDPIIAAANAEVLANDCDGFYGQEFGFYSAPAMGEAQYVNGGYFGPRGAEGVNRSPSGRVVSREPNLTPITERSEYSNRNSFMSPSMYGSGSIASPGLAQLAGMISSPEYEGGDMSLNALLKLRRGAWGGSQASLHSSNGSPKSTGGQGDGSPVSGLPPWAQFGAVGLPLTSTTSTSHRRKNSGISFISEATSEADVQARENAGLGSQNLSLSVTALDLAKPSNNIENDDADDDKQLRRHKHSASAESISYLKEEDPSKGPRWVMERRRIGETGELLGLAREVIEDGTI